MRNKRVLIVSGADARFFPLLEGLVLSMRAQEASKAVSLAFFDLGLTDAQRDWLGRFSDRIVTPGWDLPVPERDDLPEAAKSVTARIFLPTYFPGFDVYLWLDADTWLQSWLGIEYYVAGALATGAAATPQVDRSYIQGAGVLRWRFTGFSKCYGQQAAIDLMQYPHINAGAFAIRADAPHWSRLAAAYLEAMERSGEVLCSDQMAFNHAVYKGGLAVQLLPATCNWQCHLRLPLWNEETATFCEPFLPYPTISVLHLTADAKDKSFEIATMTGRRREMTLRCPLTDEQTVVGS